jgi:trigger factor
VNVTREDTESRQVVLNVELEPSDIELHLQRVYRQLVNRVQIPGFRKGKAPRSVVESFLGRNAMVQEGIDSIVTSSLNQALERESLEPFGEPEIDSLELDPVSFKATVPLEPQVDLGDFQNLRLERDPIEITEEQVTEVLEQLQRSNGVWEPREGQVRFDDLVTLDVEGTIEGNRILQDQAVDFVPRQDSPVPFPGFSIYLEGMSAGEDKQFILTVPEDYRESAVAGKECRFEVKVIEVKELRLPELDDEFAKGVGEGYDAIAELQDDIQRRLYNDAVEAAQRDLQEKALQEVIDGAEVVYPSLTEQRELDRMVEDRAHALQEHRLQAEDYVAEAGKSDEEVRAELRPEAVQRLTRFLVLRQISLDQGIEVTEDDVEDEIDQMSGTGESQEAIRNAFSTDNARSAIRNAVLSRKVQERLGEIAQSSVAEEPPARAAASEEVAQPTGTEEQGGDPNDDESP